MSIPLDKTVLPKFSGKDFTLWKARVEAIMKDKGLYQIIQKGRPIKTQATVLTAGNEKDLATKQEEFDNKNNTAVNLILSCLDDKFTKMVINCPTAGHMWKRLLSVHEQQSEANSIVLQQEFYDLRMKREETIGEFTSRAGYLQGQRQDVGASHIDSEALISRIITGLPRHFNTFTRAAVTPVSLSSLNLVTPAGSNACR